MTMNRDALLSALGDDARALEVHFFEELDSTNAYLAANPPARDALVVARRQTAGRGRRERDWQSPPGGIYLSLGRPMAEGALPSTLLPLAVGMSVARALSGFGVTEARVKWPNDIVINGCKIAGILVEKANKTLIIGIGLNWASAPIRNLPADRRTIGLADLIEADAGPDRAVVTAALVTGLLGILTMDAEELTRHGAEHWPRWDVLAGRTVTVEQADSAVMTGIAAGITPEGALRLRTAQGEQMLHSGETRIQGGWEQTA
jgi:BirA family biotin operon repressor/biotin-[acetyl-CoA-carboxylase] ligase